MDMDKSPTCNKKTNFANVSVVEELLIYRSYATAIEKKHRFPSVMDAAILEIAHPYLVLDESVTFALPHGPLSFLISSVVSVHCRLNRRPSKT